MRKIIFISLLLFSSCCILFLSWNSNQKEHEELIEKLTNSQNFIDLQNHQIQLLKEFERANSQNRDEYRKHAQYEFDRIKQSTKLSAKEKKDSLAKMGEVITDKYEELLKECNTLILKVKSDFPELSQLTPEEFKFVFKSAKTQLKNRKKLVYEK